MRRRESRQRKKERARNERGNAERVNRNRERERERGVVRAKRMTVIRPIIGWHQKCWVWLACQMGNSRRTAEASYSRLWTYRLCARTVWIPRPPLLSDSLAPSPIPPGMIWTSIVRKLPDDVNGNRRKIISPRRIRRFSAGMTS